MELERSKLILESAQNGDVEQLRILMAAEEDEDLEDELEEEIFMSSSDTKSDSK